MKVGSLGSFRIGRAGFALACVLLAAPACAASLDASAAPCSDAATQTARGECAYQDFLDASAAMSQPLRRIEAALDPKRRSAWRGVQKAWLGFRTQACQFESRLVEGGSAGTLVQWQCAARMTRQRTAELSRLAVCAEGDVACLPRSPVRKPE